MDRPKKDDAELHLEAMLYALNDPSIDREEFETRLLEDSRLGEMVSNAVQMLRSIEAVESVDSGSHPVVYLVEKRPPVLAESPSSKRGISSWLVVGSVAASLLFAGFFTWQAVRSSLDRSIALIDSKKTVSDGIDAHEPNSLSSLTKVVWAWSEVRTDGNTQLHSSICLAESEGPASLSDGFDGLLEESDVPEWLVLATAAVIEQGSGVDSPLEPAETRL